MSQSDEPSDGSAASLRGPLIYAVLAALALGVARALFQKPGGHALGTIFLVSGFLLSLAAGVFSLWVSKQISGKQRVVAAALGYLLLGVGLAGPLLLGVSLLLLFLRYPG